VSANTGTPYSDVIASAADRSVASVLPQIAIDAPDAAQSCAVMRPMPRLPPVITATFPSSKRIAYPAFFPAYRVM
jgi:hypothetical protein